MTKHPFLHNPHMRKAQLSQMCEVLGKRFEQLYHYYVVAKKRGYSIEQVYVMLEHIDALLTLLEKQQQWYENMPSNPDLKL